MDPATTDIYTLSLHDALPIWAGRAPGCRDREPDRLGPVLRRGARALDRKSTRLNSSHRCISYAVFCLKKKNIDGDSFRMDDGGAVRLAPFRLGLSIYCTG